MRKRKLKFNKNILISSCIILLVAAGFLYWFYGVKDNTNIDVKKQPTANPYVNLKPATQQQKQATENAKDLPPPSTGDGSKTSKKTVNPIISSASKTGVSAYVQGIDEDGGICTATFRQGDAVKTFTSRGVSNVSYTSCGYMEISALGSGSWSLTVSYSSSDANGVSQLTEVN